MPRRSAPSTATTRDLVTSIYVWTLKRDDANRLAARAAQELDPQFAWVEVLAAQREDPSASNSHRGLAAPSAEFAPPPGVSGESMWTYLRENGQRRDGQELQKFTQMSEPIQQAIGKLLERAPPRVLVVANLERLREYFCAEEPGPHPFIEWLNAHEITLVASSAGGPLREGIHFDYMLTQPTPARHTPRPPLVAIHQRGDTDPNLLEQLFQPLEVVSLSGLSPSTVPMPPQVARVAGG
jgi:hypothetical protein